MKISISILTLKIYSFNNISYNFVLVIFIPYDIYRFDNYFFIFLIIF